METTDPFIWFDRWFAEARAHPAIAEPTAMVLATADGAQPSARVVLLKAHDERGFVFYTNLASRKGEELAANPHAALVFYWMPLYYQVRIMGQVVAVSEAEADAYFASRAREKQIGAWASKQSQTMENRDALMERFATYEKQFEGGDVPRPPHWSGLRVVPLEIEFWHQRDARLHERTCFTRAGVSEGWKAETLYP